MKHKIKQWLEQNKCLHFWVRGVVTDLTYFRGYEHEFECSVCHKRIRRWADSEPISGIVNDPKFEIKDPRYNMNPPAIIINRDRQ